MDHGERGRRGKQKVLDRSRHLIDASESPEKYTSIHRLIACFEATWEKVKGRKVRVVYKGGFYYLGPLKWTRTMLDMELVRLLREEQQLNQIGECYED